MSRNKVVGLKLYSTKFSNSRSNDISESDIFNINYTKTRMNTSNFNNNNYKDIINVHNSRTKHLKQNLWKFNNFTLDTNNFNTLKNKSHSKYKSSKKSATITKVKSALIITNPNEKKTIKKNISFLKSNYTIKSKVTQKKASKNKLSILQKLNLSKINNKIFHKKCDTYNNTAAVTHLNSSAQTNNNSFCSGSGKFNEKKIKIINTKHNTNINTNINSPLDSFREKEQYLTNQLAQKNIIIKNLEQKIDKQNNDMKELQNKLATVSEMHKISEEYEQYNLKRKLRDIKELTTQNQALILENQELKRKEETYMKVFFMMKQMGYPLDEVIQMVNKSDECKETNNTINEESSFNTDKSSLTSCPITLAPNVNSIKVSENIPKLNINDINDNYNDEYFQQVQQGFTDKIQIKINKDQKNITINKIDNIPRNIKRISSTNLNPSNYMNSTGNLSTKASISLKTKFVN